MDPELVEEISDKIYRKFPEVKGVEPKVRKQPVPKDAPQPRYPVYLITYTKNVRGPGGKKIPRWVRVAANTRGKIIKTTTSR